jgi:hypothetical protein
LVPNIDDMLPLAALEIWLLLFVILRFALSQYLRLFFKGYLRGVW